MVLWMDCKLDELKGKVAVVMTVLLTVMRLVGKRDEIKAVMLAELMGEMKG